ncbi:hypothetical protein PEBR_19083 [Penicillium brasilianum]|uniref:Uncharacterized protein n=1 Tax=Penicillium brasilianum TaxID=104259 RepID=A0A1S9RNF9_PENBI|nr:hypothetical protein PEBR_19083 [Penicillium brasilianum]
MNFTHLTASSPTARVRGFRPVFSGQKRFATTDVGNKGGPTRLLLVAIALGVPASFYLSQRGSIKPTSPQGNVEASQPNTSTNDEPRAMGPPSGPNSMSAKQQGLSNADTMNPYVNEPGKSEKGEGETDTAKLKGTVRVDRPQV